MIDEANRHGLQRRTRSGKTDVYSTREGLLRLSYSTATFFVLLDCAFLFFKGVPLRIALWEVECALPCDEEVFRSEHPFTHPRFRFERSLSAPEAFQALFPSSDNSLTADDLTLLDTFVSIHCGF